MQSNSSGENTAPYALKLIAEVSLPRIMIETKKEYATLGVLVWFAMEKWCGKGDHKWSMDYFMEGIMIDNDVELVEIMFPDDILSK